MTITFSCECGKTLRANDDYAGRLTKCPGCGRELTIPDVDRGVQPSAPAAARERPAERRQPAEERHADDYGEGGPRGAPPATSGKAIFALVLGLLSFCLWFLTGIPAIILAFLGIRDVNRSGGRLKGKGLAVTGLVLAALNTLILCPAGAVGIYFAYAPIGERAARVQTMNNLRQLGLAMHNYHDARGHFPAAAARGPGDQPLYSWRVELLPFLGEEALYKEFNRAEPWDSPHNKKLLARMPRVYSSRQRSSAGTGMTYFQVLVSPPGTPFDQQTAPLFGGLEPPRIPHSFLDGTTNTIMIVEAAEAVPWTKPADVVYDPRAAIMPKLGDPKKTWSPVVLGDGSVRHISRTMNEQTLRNAITPAGGEVLGPDW